MTSQQRRALALEALRGRGFKPAAAKPPNRAFKGALRTKYGDVPVRLEISDWEFLSYPSITILEYPAFLPKLLAHVDSTGGLCYLRQGSILLDRYHVDGAMLQCLDAATALLERLISDPAQRAKDVEAEFLVYWAGGQKELAPVMLGEIDADARSAQYYLVRVPEEKFGFALISSDEKECERLAEAFEVDPPKALSAKCWILRSSVYPIAPSSGLPGTVKELFQYLALWDRKVYDGVQHVLKRNKDYLNYSFATFAVETPAGWLGFVFDLHRFHRKTFARKPQLYKQYLHGTGSGTPIQRLWIHEIGPSFIHSRNLSHINAAGKRITLVGCGAIGGYLAQALVRLGAGTGKNGHLKLVDAGDMAPENVGRHWLGIPSIFQPKAQAVCEELEHQFPHVSASWLQTDASRLGRSIFDCDLLIDATGEEALSELLNEAHQQRRSPKPPMLYVWIKGNGECSQAIWVDQGHACYRCLRLASGSDYLKERFPVLKDEPQTRFIGCHSFVPYAVSAPMQAAALAAEVIADWLKGDPSPRFRTRKSANADTRQVRDQNVSKLSGCPACSNP